MGWTNAEVLVYNFSELYDNSSEFSFYIYFLFIFFFLTVRSDYEINEWMEMLKWEH